MPYILRHPLLLALFIFMAFAGIVGGFPDKSAADKGDDGGKCVPESKQGGVSFKRMLTAAGLAVGLLLSAGGTAGGIGGNIVPQQKPTAEVGAVQQQQRHQQGQTLPWMDDTWQQSRKLLDAMGNTNKDASGTVSPAAVPNLSLPVDEIHEIDNDDDDKTVEEMKIRHGHPIPDIRQLPFMATTWNNGTRWCACTVLSPWYVLMAAHCFFYRNTTDPPLVVLAGTRKAKLEADNGVQRKIVDWWTYSEKDFWGMDIAIGQLDDQLDIGLNSLIKPVTLSRKTNSTDARAFIAGWGTKTGKVTKLPSILRGANVTIWTPDHCTTRVREHEICAYGEDGANNCYYDSGGPLLIRNQTDDGWEQIGIIIGGNPECKLTAVQTAVSFYCEWIAKVTKLGGKGEVNCAD